MLVDVTIVVNPHPNVLTVPARAVSEQNGKTMVKVLQNGKYVAKQIKLGFKSGENVEVVSGLNEGDQVAVPKLQTQSQSQGQGQGQGQNRSVLRMGGGNMGHMGR
jgi:HlyD family secretion protein